jgi:hypothetical protein
VEKIYSPTKRPTTNNNNVDENYQKGYQPEELPTTQDPTARGPRTFLALRDLALPKARAVDEQQEKHETDNE